MPLTRGRNFRRLSPSGTKLDAVFAHSTQTGPFWFLLLADANSRVGDELSAAVGPENAEATTSKCRPFHDFLLQHDVWLPATFSTTHAKDDDGATWQHTGGTWSRIDFLGLPQQWDYTFCQARTAMEVDLSLCREDHRAAACTFSSPMQMKAAAHRPASTKLTEACIDSAALWRSDQHQIVRPELDAHTHAALVQRQIVQQIKCQPSKKRKRPLKQTLSDDTWRLILQKREWRNTLAEHHRARKKESLLLYFMSWKMTISGAQAQRPDLVARDIVIAQALSSFRRLEVQTKAEGHTTATET